MSCITATLKDGREATLRAAEPDDVPALIELFNTVYLLALDPDRVARDIDEGHTVVAHAGDRMVAFRKQRRLGPDVLGDGSMVVAPDYWRSGLGSAVVDYFERSLPPQWKASVVINSTEYETKVPKPDAGPFWLACGYRQVADTGNSRIFIKQY